MQTFIEWLRESELNEAKINHTFIMYYDGKEYAKSSASNSADVIDKKLTQSKLVKIPNFDAEKIKITRTTFDPKLKGGSKTEDVTDLFKRLIDALR